MRGNSAGDGCCPAVAEETRVSIPTQTTTYTLSGATPFVVETGNTVATDTATSAAIVGDNSNDWDLLIESGAVVGSSLTDSQAMNLDSLTGATSVHNQGRSPVPTKMERYCFKTAAA